MLVAQQCPKCGANFAGEDDVTCRYCGTKLTAVGAKADAAAPSKSPALLYAALGIPAVLLGVLALVVLLRHDAPAPAPVPSATASASTSARVLPSASSTPPAAPPDAAPPPSPFADLAFEFGEKGKGAGQLDDAFQLAVDANGDVYVTSFDSSRIQHFDPEGKFVGSFELEPGLVQGIATTHDGNLWVARGGDLVKLALPSGKVVKTVPNQKPKVSYQAVAVDATNGLYATNIGALSFISMDGKLPQSDNIRKLDANGNLIAAWKDVGGNTGASLAVDAEGNLYVAERRSQFIDIIDRTGKVKARFAGPHGSAAGIVVDSQGRILTGAAHGVTVFDATGTKLGSIGTEEVKCIAAGPKNQLYILMPNGPIRVMTLR